MPAIIEIDPDEDDPPHGRKCTTCNFRAGTLYRFADEHEEIAQCGDCFVQFLLKDDIVLFRPDTRIAELDAQSTASQESHA